jgi:hypothetical protein
VTAPALPAGWTTLTVPPSEPAWVTTTSGPDTPPNAAFASEPPTSSDKSLVSPAFTVPPGGSILKFRHKFNFDAGFDGGVLEIKIGNSPAAQFEDWIDAGGTFTSNGYNDEIDGSFGNPIVDPVAGTRPAWTNSSNGQYITTTATFPPSASAQMVQLRFRMGTDTLVGGEGWKVDGIAVNEHFTCCTGSPVSVVSRKVHGTAGTFDIDLPLTGPRGVECRVPGQTGTAGVDYKLVFTFPTPITGCGAASTGMLVSGPMSNQCTVNLTGVPNAQYTTVTLSGVTSSAGSGNASGTMGLLIGDTSANGLVNSTDISQVQAQSGKAVTGNLGTGNYRTDVTANGLINSTDISTTQSKSGTGLPSTP